MLPCRVQLVEEDGLLAFVHSLYGFQYRHFVAVLLGRFDECLHVFGKTRASVAASGIQEFAADTGVGSDTVAHHVDIRSHAFTQIGDVVHE